jgi:hypothetical protein
MFYLIINNGDKITAFLSIHFFEPKEIHEYADYVYTGHMKPFSAQKKIDRNGKWSG